MGVGVCSSSCFRFWPAIWLDAVASGGVTVIAGDEVYCDGDCRTSGAVEGGVVCTRGGGTLEYGAAKYEELG